MAAVSSHVVVVSVSQGVVSKGRAVIGPPRNIMQHNTLHGYSREGWLDAHTGVVRDATEMAEAARSSRRRPEADDDDDIQGKTVLPHSNHTHTHIYTHVTPVS